MVAHGRYLLITPPHLPTSGMRPCAFYQWSGLFHCIFPIEPLGNSDTCCIVCDLESAYVVISALRRAFPTTSGGGGAVGGRTVSGRWLTSHMPIWCGAGGRSGDGTGAYAPGRRRRACGLVPPPHPGPPPPGADVVGRAPTPATPPPSVAGVDRPVLEWTVPYNVVGRGQTRHLLPDVRWGW